jgi:hypothetical protein
MKIPKDKKPVGKPEEPVLGDGGLPLPTPYPEYMICPHCGELEVEIWCNETGVNCHACGKWIEHEIPPDCQSAAK